MTTDRPLRVMLVEDHQLVRAAIGHAFEGEPDLEVVASVGSAEEALAIIGDIRPDVALIDLDLPGMRGQELVRELTPRYPDLWTVMLTISRSERDLFDSVRSGARGYLRKDLSPDALVRAMLDVRSGVMPMSRKDASLLIGRLVEGAGRHRPVGLGRLPELTSRENEVLALLAEGLTDREIAVALVISRRTVESHVRNILDKLAVTSRLQAARLYRARASEGSDTETDAARATGP